MLYLTIRTDKPEAEIDLFDDMKQLDSEIWQAHRQLAETMHTKIAELFKRNAKALSNLQGIVCYQGPGSFTGLRIGLTVANTLAYSYGLPIVASQGDAWMQTGATRLLAGETDSLALPFYGAEVHITPQRK